MRRKKLNANTEQEGRARKIYRAKSDNMQKNQCVFVVSTMRESCVQAARSAASKTHKLVRRRYEGC